MRQSLRRLTEEEPSGLSAQLLRAGQKLQPPPQVAAKTLSRLGLAAAVVTAGTKVAAAGTPAVLVVLKWGGIGLLVGVSSVSVLEALGSVTVAVPGEGSVPVPGGASAVPRHAAGSAWVKAARPDVSDEVQTVREGQSRAILPAVPSGSRSASQLAEELVLLDRVREILRRRAPLHALELLREHRRRFPQPQLAEEAAYLRSRALQSSDNQVEASRAADAFRKQYPNSTLPRRWGAR